MSFIELFLGFKQPFFTELFIYFISLQLEPPKFKVFPVEDSNQVFEDLAECRITGRAVFKFGSQSSAHLVDNHWTFQFISLTFSVHWHLLVIENAILIYSSHTDWREGYLAVVDAVGTNYCWTVAVVHLPCPAGGAQNIFLA